MKSIFERINELQQSNQAGILCTLVRSRGSTPRRETSKMLVYADGSFTGTIGGGEMEQRVIAAALEALQSGKPRLVEYNMTDPERGDPGVCGGQVEIFLEPLLPKPVLLLVGSGHVGKAVAYLAHWLGFRIVVTDDRPGFCTPEAVPEGDEFYPFPLQELPQHFEITPWTYIVLTTRGADVDIAGLPAILGKPSAYLGVIGSRRRWQITCQKLVEKGVSQSLLDQVRSPIGLELNAETPEEIAVSIMAEIIMLRQGGDGSIMSHSPQKERRYQRQPKGSGEEDA